MGGASPLAPPRSARARPRVRPGMTAHGHDRSVSDGLQGHSHDGLAGDRWDHRSRLVEDSGEQPTEPVHDLIYVWSCLTVKEQAPAIPWAVPRSVPSVSSVGEPRRSSRPWSLLAGSSAADPRPGPHQPMDADRVLGDTLACVLSRTTDGCRWSTSRPRPRPTASSPTTSPSGRSAISTPRAPAGSRGSAARSLPVSDRRGTLPAWWTAP